MVSTKLTKLPPHESFLRWREEQKLANKEKRPTGRPRVYESKIERDAASRKRRAARMAADPEYAALRRAQQNASWKRRVLTAEQTARRRELERHRYHTRDKHDPRWKAEHNLRVRLNKFLFGHKSITIRELLGCSKETLVAYIEKRFKRGMTWKNYGTAWNIDHIQPCAAFDLTDPDEQRKCFHLSNLRPEWAKENKSRGAKIITHQPELLIRMEA